MSILEGRRRRRTDDLDGDRDPELDRGGVVGSMAENGRWWGWKRQRRRGLVWLLVVVVVMAVMEPGEVGEEVGEVVLLLLLL